MDVARLGAGFDVSPGASGSGSTPQCSSRRSCSWSSSGCSGTWISSWFVFPLFGWGILLAAHAVYAFVIRAPEEIMIEREMRKGEEQP
jgi:hypothetical protein